MMYRNSSARENHEARHRARHADPHQQCDEGLEDEADRPDDRGDEKHGRNTDGDDAPIATTGKEVSRFLDAD
jgi:hypothetical protein